MCFLGWRGHHLDAFLKRVRPSRRPWGPWLRKAICCWCLAPCRVLLEFVILWECDACVAPKVRGRKKCESTCKRGTREIHRMLIDVDWSYGVIEPSRHGFRHVWQMPQMWCNSLPMVYGCFALSPTSDTSDTGVIIAWITPYDIQTNNQHWMVGWLEWQTNDANAGVP